MKKLMQAEKAFAMLKRQGVECADYAVAKSMQQCMNAAAKLKYPVAMKILSSKIVHKSDSGAVKTNIQNERQLEEAYNVMHKSAKNIKVKPEGFLVQKMEKGIEVIIGMKRDSQFGPVVVFGLGGIFVEILKDVSMRIAPVEKKDCIEMINEIKGSAMLKGARGTEHVNESSLADIIMALSSISMKNKSVVEIDLNPVMAGAKKSKVVDARIITEK